MKLIDHFNTFMTDVVNLNATRVTQLEDSIEALKGVLLASDWAPKIRFFAPQGSWAHKTIRLSTTCNQKAPMVTQGNKCLNAGKVHAVLLRGPGRSEISAQTC